MSLARILLGNVRAAVFTSGGSPAMRTLVAFQARTFASEKKDG